MKRSIVASLRWFSAEQALAWALQAYYAACREVEPPPGVPLVDSDGSLWAGKGEFLHAFHSALTVRLSLAAFAHGGIAPCGSASEQLGWPDDADVSGKVEFFERLKIAGLPLPENAGNNALAGEIA